MDNEAKHKSVCHHPPFLLECSDVEMEQSAMSGRKHEMALRERR